jgi:hypothetical protein
MTFWSAGNDITGAKLNDMFLAILRDFAGTGTTATSETSASTTYTDLATVGPSVTLTSVGTLALVLFEATMFNNSAATNGTLMSVAVSGATTIAAADADSIKVTIANSGVADRHSGFAVFTITPGVNTYRGKYRAGAGTSAWADRKIWVFAP